MTIPPLRDGGAKAGRRLDGRLSCECRLGFSNCRTELVIPSGPSDSALPLDESKELKSSAANLAPKKGQCAADENEEGE